MRLPEILEVGSSDNKNENLFMKGLLPHPHPRSLQKPAIAQTHASGLAWAGRGVCWAFTLILNFPSGAKLCAKKRKRKSPRKELRNNGQMMEQMLKCRDFTSDRLDRSMMWE